jgi:hypothetical protein
MHKNVTPSLFSDRSSWCGQRVNLNDKISLSKRVYCPPHDYFLPLVSSSLGL